MNNYTVIGIDLAKKTFHLAALNEAHKVVLKEKISREDFMSCLPNMFAPRQTFALEACSGCHDVGRFLEQQGHKVIALKTKDVKAYAVSRQKNDINDAIAICKASLDPELKHVRLKTVEEQEISYLHKSRQNTMRQRIQKSNSLMASLHEFGLIADCGKTKFAKLCRLYVQQAFELKKVSIAVYEEMLLDCQEIDDLLSRENRLEHILVAKNKASEVAQRLESIPGIGPINASILSIKPMEIYESARDFAASLGLVPRQHTTGGHIHLGGISKQGDRYARTMLIQAGRCLVMRSFKQGATTGPLYDFIHRLRKKGKGFNVICVAVANKLARIAYACVIKGVNYQAASTM